MILTNFVFFHRRDRNGENKGTDTDQVQMYQSQYNTCDNPLFQRTKAQRTKARDLHQEQQKILLAITRLRSTLQRWHQRALEPAAERSKACQSTKAPRHQGTLEYPEHDAARCFWLILPIFHELCTGDGRPGGTLHASTSKGHHHHHHPRGLQATRHSFTCKRCDVRSDT